MYDVSGKSSMVDCVKSWLLHNPFQETLERMRAEQLKRNFWNDCYKPEFRGGYVVRRGFRGSGMLWAAAQRVGYDGLLGKLIRIRLRYPLWYEGDDLIRELQLKIWKIEVLPEIYDQFVESVCTHRLSTEEDLLKFQERVRDGWMLGK